MKACWACEASFPCAEHGASPPAGYDFGGGDLRAAIRRACGCCGITVTGFDSEFVRLGLCGTCRGLAENSLGISGSDMLDKVHLVKHYPANRARGAKR